MNEIRPKATVPSAEVASRIALPAQDEDVATLRRAVVAKLTYAVGKDPIVANERDWFVAVALTVRDRIVDRWMPSTRSNYASGDKRVYYLSLEFLIGRLLYDSLNNLGLTDTMRAALSELGVDLDRLRSSEPDAALGNGGLGRLAACFMESMASLSIPAYGYGIRYDHGLFRQVIKDGWQQEYPEDWLSFGNPWEFERPEVEYPIGFGGSVEPVSEDGATRYVWHPGDVVDAVAYDTPVVGWRGRHVNTLRLWSARATNPLRLDAFNEGDYVGAHSGRVWAEAISDVLYPSDETPAGQELRLRQEYFFTAASLQDLIRRHLNQHKDIRTLPDKVAIQLNDTHPAIAVAELMRILVDLHNIPWAEAWEITNATISYTNHTLMPEALETWPVALMGRLLPRHMQIIFMINGLHLDSLRQSGKNDDALLSSVSLIDEQGGRRVRMGNLAFLGAHKVNGVSALHTDLLKQTVFRDFNSVYPDRIVNKTNGITFRRWLFEANPGLTRLIVDAVGERAMDDAGELTKLAAVAGDASFQEKYAANRRAKKAALSDLIAERLDIKVDPDALFDVQIKRIHEYKRQFLNILETIALYNAMRAQPQRDWVPRVKIFAGKAAASYHRAKLIIKLINDVAKVVNSDPTVQGKLKVVFLPNYNVSLAENIIPAADLSEQISTAGMEASGTGNMKLALNGGLTIGTMDGANVEIYDRVGADNIFIFGLTAAEVTKRWSGGYDARATLAASPMLSDVFDTIYSGIFSPGESGRYTGLLDGLLNDDRFLVTADFDAYYARQRDVATLWRNREEWWKAAILNTANVGFFSSDRTIREYSDEIWNVHPRTD
ncbi:glycogen phosphorylase [Faunimonas pinastri]|uniref:Alpha-1,4 glucan phosphorylase n=1 Tax=Faunimonas pinastri TaxID=1855383 RepID=A0A1H8ZEX2_9HYPH|nr:glycogen/starch/alpha-glucan phosphorylase [Faunimonas pinastri]SEP62956.1 glycogen phosphorylase [Faunimonas pinastri]